MPIVSTTKLTARQFVRRGDEPPGVRFELVDGEIAVSPSPRSGHSHVEKTLSYFLMAHIRQNKLGRLLGDVDTVFGELDVRRPDILFYRQDRGHLVNEDDALFEPPDLCVEILSPSSRTIDRRDKLIQYAKGGVAYYWIVDPKKRVIEAYGLKDGQYELLKRAEGDERVRLRPFEELELPLDEIWFTA